MAMAEQLGLDEIRAAAMVDVGSAQSSLGGEDGIRTLARAIDVAREANAAFDLARAMGNLGAFRWQAGKLEGVGKLRLEALQAAQEYGQVGFARWFRGVMIIDEYERGDWRGGYARVDAFIAEVEAGAPHYLAAQCYLHRALIRLGYGEESELESDVERGLALAERAKDPQTLYMALAIGAHVRAQQGDLPGAIPLADQFLSAVAQGDGLGFGIAYVHVLAWTLTACGRGAEAVAALKHYARNPWARAGIAFGRGEPAAAADLFAEMGAHASESFCRIAAARGLVEQDRRAEADTQLRPALAFYQEAGATRYVREAESLLTGSSSRSA
jgi:hypothetical protein